MSGLNPFRPRKPENFSIHHHSSSTSVSTNAAFSTPPSSSTASQNILFKPNGLSGTPPTSHFSGLDDSMSSDDQSVLDPFHPDTSMNEDNIKDGEGAVSSATWGSSRPSLKPHDDDRLQAPIHRIAPPTAPYFSQPAPVVPTTQSPGETGRASSQERLLDRENHRSSRSTTSTSSIRSLTPHGETRSTGNCATNVPQNPVRTEPSKRPVIGDPLPPIDTDAKPLSSRSGNRDKIPPPPPKSHHGKLINPSPSSTSSPAQSAPPKVANRFSFHSSSPESSYSPKPSQSGMDYFAGTGGSESEKPSETLRRSQSQYKRPPTPPLSRRHSQMRRSKTTLSKPTLGRLSMPAVKPESTESPPPSPSSWSLNPSRTRDARPRAPSEENSRRPSLQGSGAMTSTLGAETSTSSSSANSRTPSTKRTSISNPLPPPPPPRRTRGSSSQSNDSTRPTSLRSEKQTEVHEEYIPHPSNASDILADLSRLQKEVDDLRVHYESRKTNQ
ncbi:hypothetical protein BDV28DRAFT_141611 [Aspergillus coremiiformis]|uniref:Uncharacterized protein n=1 Tax=Aspergillus coremiiformis TaxID=138285 RepID=A0A5N6YVW1_9EURO|nr:hypothetical protein BDV28DRAFT_141611 [Aspergillus coremiiformis]